MAVVRFVLLSCSLMLLAFEINAQSCSSSSIGTLNGVEVPQQPVVLPPTQPQYLISVPQNICAPRQLVGIYVKACSNDNSLSIQTSNPWNVLLSRQGVRGNANVYLSVFCS